MKHSFIRFVGGLISFLGIADIISAAHADNYSRCSSISYITSSTNPTTRNEFVHYRSLSGVTWYYNWPDVKYTGGALWDALPEFGTNNLDGGWFLAWHKHNGTTFHFPAYEYGGKLAKYCLLPPGDTLYYVSGAALFKPACAIADGSSYGGIYTAGSRLATSYGCCYSGENGLVTGTGASGSGGVECRCYYTEARSGKAYKYDGSIYSNIQEIKETKYCYRFVNCAPGYYQATDDLSVPDGKTGEYCFETAPGLFGPGQTNKDSATIGICQIPDIYYTSPRNGAGINVCTTTGCTATGYRSFDWYVPGRCYHECPSSKSSVSNYVGAGRYLTVHFASTVENTHITGSGVSYSGYSGMRSTVGINSCRAAYYTAEDSNGNEYQVSCNSNYQ